MNSNFDREAALRTASSALPEKAAARLQVTIDQSQKEKEYFDLKYGMNIGSIGKRKQLVDDDELVCLFVYRVFEIIQ